MVVTLTSNFLFPGVIPIGGIIIFIMVTLMGVWIYKFRTQRDKVSDRAPKDARKSVDEILKEDFPISPNTEQPESNVRKNMAHEEEEIKPILSPAPQSQPTVEKLLHSIESEDVRELIKERDSELVSRLEDWALEVVDTMDEISRMPQEKGTAAYIERLRSQLAALDCTLIDSDKWDPELQRAIKVEEAVTPGSAPCITRKISTGLRVRGKLVRKQTVIIKK